MTVAYVYQQVVSATLHGDEPMLAYLWRGLEEECRDGAREAGIPLDPGPVDRHEEPLWMTSDEDGLAGWNLAQVYGADKDRPDAYMLIVRAHFPKELPVDRPLAPVPHQATPAPEFGTPHALEHRAEALEPHPHLHGPAPKQHLHPGVVVTAPACAVCGQPVWRDESGAWEHVAAGSTAGGDPLAVTPT